MKERSRDEKSPPGNYTKEGTNDVEDSSSLLAAAACCQSTESEQGQRGCCRFRNNKCLGSGDGDVLDTRIALIVNIHDTNSVEGHILHACYARFPKISFDGHYTTPHSQGAGDFATWGDYGMGRVTDKGRLEPMVNDGIWIRANVEFCAVITYKNAVCIRTQEEQGFAEQSEVDVVFAHRVNLQFCTKVILTRPSNHCTVYIEVVVRGVVVISLVWEAIMACGPIGGEIIIGIACQFGEIHVEQSGICHDHTCQRHKRYERFLHVGKKNDY